MYIVCADLEGVFIPEVWINVAQRTGIDELKLTTRDIADYDELMQYRLRILDREGLKLQDIQAAIATMDPLPGAVEFLDWIRSRTQIILLSDTFLQFAQALMPKLKMPTLFCHSLEVAEDGRITNYKLRQEDGKRKVVQALKGLQYQIVAFGDSYNDTRMLAEADQGILFRPPDNVIKEFPQFPVTREYGELKGLLEKYI